MNAAKLRRFGAIYCPGGALGFNPDLYTQFVGPEAVAQRHYRLSGKHRSPVRTKYRLSAYATLRPRVVAVGSRR
jgi:hypothetical protein